jgi:hypothetical protein
MALDSPVTGRSKTLKALALAGACSAGVGIFFPFDPWIGLGLAAVFFGAAAALACQRTLVRRVFVAATATTLAGLSIETFFAVRAKLVPAEGYVGNYSSQAYWNDHDPVLGYAPRAGATGTSTKIIGGREVYRATYSIDSNALRRTSLTDDTNPAANCLFFFGDSFTFGEGLNDEDTLPWIVQEQAGTRWKTLNFGFHGYGPHQMLASIESGRVQQAAGACPGRLLVVTQYSEQHVGRALGRDSWDLHGPWYVVNDHGVAVHAGRLDERPGADSDVLSGRFRPEVLKWLDWQRLFWVSDSDRRFFVALLATARDRLAAVYPRAEWHLILLDVNPNALVTGELERRGIQVHPIRSILPVWRTEHPDYSISGDGHPNRRYNQVLAGWIESHLLDSRQ